MVYNINCPCERSHDDELGTDGIEWGGLCKWLLVMVLLGAVEGSPYARYDKSCVRVYLREGRDDCLKLLDGRKSYELDTSTEYNDIQKFVCRGKCLFVHPDGMVLDRVEIKVGAIAGLPYASYNKKCPVYLWEAGRKAGGENLKSPDGHIYNSKDPSAEPTVIRLYRCQLSRSCRSDPSNPSCQYTVSVYPDGMVLDRVRHYCQPKQDEGKDKSRSRQLEESGYRSSSPNIPMPHSATSSGNMPPMPMPLIDREASLQPLLSGNEATNPPHTQHVRHSSVDMYMEHRLSRENQAPCIVPDRLTVKEGCNVFLKCKYSDGTYPTGHITWYGPHGIIGQNENDRVYSSAHLLSIDPVMLSDSGDYWCTLETGIQSYVSNLKVTKPPAILNPIKKQTICLGETGSIDCYIDLGFPASTVIWYKDDAIISDARITIMDNRLQIQNIQHSDEGIYMCCAHNVVGSASVMIAVSCSDDSQLGVLPEFTTNPQDQLDVIHGSAVAFSAEAGNDVEYRWKHNGVYMRDEILRVNGSNTPSLTIFSAELENEGTYKCVASNEHGEVPSQSARLELRKEWSGIPQMTVLQSSHHFNYPFDGFMKDDQNIGQFVPQYQGTGTEMQQKSKATQTTVSVSSWELPTEESSTSPVDTESIKLLKEGTDTGEHSELIREWQRMFNSYGEIDSTTLLDCNSQDTVGEELHVSPQEESNISQGHSLIVSGNIMRTYDTVPAQATDSVGSSELVIERSITFHVDTA